MSRALLTISYHPKQEEIFSADARFKIIAKGRRFGLTRGFANYCIERALTDEMKILWVDTIYANIERYVDRYFRPVLRTIPKRVWRYRMMKSDMIIGKSVIDFRSADRPENLEGFGYNLIILNEAGIILKDPFLWNESIRPMALDYEAEVLIGGTPKGKYIKGEKHLFFELWERGEINGEWTMDNEKLIVENEKLIMNNEQLPEGEKDLKDNKDIKDGKEIKYKRQWMSFNYSTYDNPLLKRSEIDEMVKEISPQLREQEVYGRFVDKATEGIIKEEWWKKYELAISN